MAPDDILEVGARASSDEQRSVVMGEPPISDRDWGVIKLPEMLSLRAALAAMEARG